ncbi:MAG: YHS domain-containing protein, partial [Stellaceae bacterium]
MPDGHQPSSARDPVCGMTVDPAVTPHRAHHRGRHYFFCNAGCRAKFTAAPEIYLEPAATAPMAAPGAT